MWQQLVQYMDRLLLQIRDHLHKFGSNISAFFFLMHTILSASVTHAWLYLCFEVKSIIGTSLLYYIRYGLSLY